MAQEHGIYARMAMEGRGLLDDKDFAFAFSIYELQGGFGHRWLAARSA